MARTIISNRAATRWTVRIIPAVIAIAFGVTTYAVVARLCVQYLYREKGRAGLVAGLLVLYFLTLGLTLAAYFRIFITVQRNPGLVPLASDPESNEKNRKSQTRRNDRDVEERAWVPPDPNPDSPGLEAFYSKEVFVCESDGRPKWCSECSQWKPDRASHSSELGRCVRKMDHLCPWVGGMVSETSFNFFLQFTFYCCLYCALCLGTSAYCLSRQNKEDRPTDGWVIAVVVLSAFFGFFTLAMAMTSMQFILSNKTNIDMLRKTQTFQLAVHIAQPNAPSDKYRTVTYPLQSNTHGTVGGQIDGSASGSSAPATDRDLRATRTFAILSTETGENPWNLGLWRNWKCVMGDNIVEWILPIRHSPCCNHESMVSDYPFGPLLSELKKRHGVSDGATNFGNGIEMHERALSGA